MKQSVIFNYSSITLTEQMDKLINRGLNFTILPFKLDITEVLVDFKRFARSTIWHEFWYGKEDNQDTIYDIFRNKNFF